jgi:hypothetical protein
MDASAIPLARLPVVLAAAWSAVRRRTPNGSPLKGSIGQHSSRAMLPLSGRRPATQARPGCRRHRVAARILVSRRRGDNCHVPAGLDASDRRRPCRRLATGTDLPVVALVGGRTSASRPSWPAPASPRRRRPRTTVGRRPADPDPRQPGTLVDLRDGSLTITRCHPPFWTAQQPSRTPSGGDRRRRRRATCRSSSPVATWASGRRRPQPGRQAAQRDRVNAGRLGQLLRTRAADRGRTARRHRRGCPRGRPRPAPHPRGDTRRARTAGSPPPSSALATAAAGSPEPRPGGRRPGSAPRRHHREPAACTSSHPPPAACGPKSETYRALGCGSGGRPAAQPALRESPGGVEHQAWPGL